MTDEERFGEPIRPEEVIPQGPATPTGSEPGQQAPEVPGAQSTPGQSSLAGPVAPSTGSYTQGNDLPATSDDDRLMGALSWLGLVILQIPLVSFVLLISESNKHRPFQRYHAVTSILFWVAAFVYEILAVVVYLVLTAVTLGCLGLFLWVLFFLPHLAGLYYAYQAYQGKQPEIPLISDLARRQNWS